MARSITVTVVWSLTPCSLEVDVLSAERNALSVSTLRNVTGRHSKKLVRIKRIARRHIPEDGNLKQNTLLLCNLSAGIKIAYIIFVCTH